MENNPYDSPQAAGNTPLSLSAVGQVRTLQIITLAMAMGVSAFAMFCLWTTKFAFDGEPSTLSWIGFGFAAVIFLLSMIVPRANVGTAMKRVNATAVLAADEAGQFSKLFPIRQTSHIIACALLESATFLNVFVYMTTSYVGNIVVAAVLLGLILFRFPSIHGSETWVADRVQELKVMPRS